MSISGSALRTSTVIQSTQRTAPAASRPIVLPEPQPQLVVSETAIMIAATEQLISTAASQLTRPGTRTGDGGTNHQVVNTAITAGISGTQNSQCQLRCSMIKPPITTPAPVPTPRIDDIRPIEPAIRSRGNSSRTIP